MRSWRFHKFGDLSELKLEVVDVPEPGEDECLVQIAFAALNPADRLLVMGLYPTTGKPPFSVGRDGSGTVVTPGKSGRFKTGDQVVFLRSIIGITRGGTLADYVTVPEAHLAHLPDWWSFEDGAAAPHTLLTSWQALKEVSDLKPGETVLISGASGGIGTGSLLLSGLMGARTIALSRSKAKRSELLALGAKHVFDPRDEALVNKIKELGGVDVVIETVCGDFLPKTLEMARPYGRICVIGALGGIDCRINPTNLIFKRLQVHGIQVAMYSDGGVQDAWHEICDLIQPTRARVVIDKIFPFKSVPTAFAHLKKGPMGKVLIGPINQ
jgi:NADPH:quinone reductase